METRRDLAFDKSLDFLRFLLRQPGLRSEWDRHKNRIFGQIDEQEFSFRLPLPLPLPGPQAELPSYLADLDSQPTSYLLLLIQAGHSALAYFEGGEMRHHKVIKKYMVRGNGKAQVGYLQTRGKSKAGSRVRLANSITFFEDINAKLREWEVADDAARILVSCGEKLRPLWFGSHVTPPFEKDDARLLKVPIDVHRPDLEELERVNKTILRGRWEGPAAWVDTFFDSLGR